ncbi:MAG: HlyD family efflux transporter periplasmic adaptor subunit [Cardiobacteriaceae bacterium]|nr:HlyD family efflux transporter periplasmic adaptor subunit [Cardiobacteriaceae bacterium]
MKKLLFLLLLVALGAGGWWFHQHEEATAQPSYIDSSNSRLILNRIDVATLYAGRVKTVHIEDGDTVTTGKPLVTLSSEQSTGQLAAAQAATQAAQETVQRARAGVQQAKQTVARADAEVSAYRQQQKVAKLELDNARKMRRDNLVSASELTKRQADFERAVASVKAAEAARAEAQAAVAQVEAQVQEAEAGVRRAQATTDTAASADADMVVRSPVDALVEYRLVDPGNVVGAGSRVATLLDPTDVSMNLFLPNTTMSQLRVGDEARIVLDGIDAVFPAKISFIASDAQFTPKTVETVNEREKLVFKVTLKIPRDTALRYERLLKGGMTGNGYVRSDTNQPWPATLDIKLPQ